MSESNPRARPPAALAVTGALGLIVAAVSLCVAAYRFAQPETGMPPMAGQRLLEDGFVRTVVMLTLALLVVASIGLAVAAAGLLLGRPWARRLTLVWAWSTLAIEALAVIGNAIALGARAGHAEIGALASVAAALSVPTTGCCVSVFALATLVVMYHDAVRRWAAGPTGG